MSSPLTAGLVADPLTTLLAAAAIRTAQALAEGIAEAERLRTEHSKILTDRQDSQRQSEQTGIQHLLHAEQGIRTKLEELALLGDRLGIGEQLRRNIPERPEPAGQTELATYVRNLESLVSNVQNILLTEIGLHHQESDTEAALSEAFLPPSEITQEKPSSRLLARIAHLGSIPDDISALAFEYDQCLPGERADLLATELRLRIRQLLQTSRQKALDAATTTVIEQSLKDLGYQIEPIAETLYLSGGMLHFRRAGWGDYMVRMRLDFRHKTANFNVIRAVDEHNNMRSVTDHLAEDRWCAEFPALIRALEAQGVQLQVTRQVEPGDLPVQQVLRDHLPRFSEDESSDPIHAPLARKQ